MVLGLDELCSLSAQGAVITGAASGIGEAVARRFAAAGADLLLVDLDEARLARVGDELGARSVACDITDWDAASRIAASFDADILVNCAGLFPSGSILELDEAHWDRMFDVNLKAAMRMTQALGAGMVARGRGSIVNIASIQGLRPSAGKAAYAASKAGLISFTQVAARELAPAVRVNAVAPGPILTDVIKARLAAEGVPAGSRGVGQVPVGRMGEPDDIARIVQYLASPAAGFVTGATWLIDGGSILV